MVNNGFIVVTSANGVDCMRGNSKRSTHDNDFNPALKRPSHDQYISN